MTNYIPPAVVEKINNTAKLLDVAQETFPKLKRSGTSHLTDCPHCGGKKKMTISPSKDIWKCFKCDEGGVGAVSFVRANTQHKTFPEACHYLAKLYHIPVEEVKNSNSKTPQVPFRNLQLQLSGIQEVTQQYTDPKGNEKDRYQSGTYDKYGNIIDGPDMIITYLGLDWQALTYKTPRGKERAFTRIRYANPALHPDKNGDPIRYRSPYKSGSHLYIPNALIHAYNSGTPIETLIVIEGEKKADKLCQHGMFAVAVGGIHNFAFYNEMPYQFEQIIRTCGVQKVLFMVDADWQELSSKENKPVDQRPRTFCKAVTKYQKYFHAYKNEGIELQIFFGYHKNNLHKGIDDFFVHELKGDEETLKPDLDFATTDRGGVGVFLQVHDITFATEYKLQEYWMLHDVQAFIDQHRAVLKQRKSFFFGRVERRWDKKKEAFELVQKIMPYEQFWKDEVVEDERTGRTKIIKTTFNYVEILDFLRNRGFGILRLNSKTLRFIQVKGKTVEEVTALDIQRFVMDFTRELGKKHVLAMLLRGAKQYLGADKLANMYYLNLQFNQADERCQYLYFKNGYLKITRDTIVHRPLAELPQHIWKDKIIDFEFKLQTKPIVSLDRKGNNWDIQEEKGLKESCDMAMFYYNTSCFFWEKVQELVTTEDGHQKYIDRDSPKPISKEELHHLRANYAAKIIATGYILHEHRDWSNMKAVICMDGVESEVGKSQGGTGKSLFSKQFSHMVPTFVVNGKKLDPRNPDNHLFDGVDERTGVIVINDVRVNFDFEAFFGDITEGVEVNPKGEKKFTVEPPKFIVSTNHAIGGNDNSHDRRQFLLTFSDYYNRHRTPYDDFGHQLFYDWDWKQWNLYYNFIACCIQSYLRHGLKYTIPMEAIEKRKLRQQMGESFLEWAEDIFDKKSNTRNHAICKRLLFEDFLDKYPKEKRYCDTRKFKARMKQFCLYSKTSFNPQFDGDRHKSNGKEFFTIADERFDASKYKLITRWNDLREKTGPF